MRIVTLKDEDFNQPYTLSTDVKQINNINAEWEFLFREDNGGSLSTKGDWRTAGYAYKPSDSNWDSNYRNEIEHSIGDNSLTDAGIIDNIFRNHRDNFSQGSISEFGKVFNPYFLKYGTFLFYYLDRDNFKYTEKVYVEGFDNLTTDEVWYDNTNEVYHLVNYNGQYNSNGNSNVVKSVWASVEGDKEIRREISSTPYGITVPYLKDSQIHKMFEEVRKTPWERVLFKVNAGKCNITFKKTRKQISYIWKPSKNIVVRLPTSNITAIWYKKGVEYTYKEDVFEGELPTYRENIEIENLSFSSDLANPCNFSSGYNGEFALCYIPSNTKIMVIPTLDVAVDIRDQITTEVQARKDGDAELLQKINKEAQDRTNAINTEATARTNADNALDQKITTEKNDRIKDVDDEENARKKAIEEEAKTRKEEDDKLEDKKLNRFDKDEEVDGVKPDWDEEPTRNSHKAVNSDAVYKMCKNLRLYQANIGKDKIAVAKLKPVDYPFQVTIFSKGEMATFDIHSTVMGRALTPGCNLSAKYYMTSDWIYLYFKPAQGPVSLTISANDSEGMMLTETDKFPEIATTVPLAK